jgi:CAAX protease family protein
MQGNEQGLSAEGVETQTVTTRNPVIRQGWLRTVFFLVAVTLATVVFGILGFLVVLLLNGSGTSIMDLDQSEFTANLGAGYLAILQGFAMVGIFLCLWIFRRFVDRKSIVSLGFTWGGYRRDFLAGAIWGVGLISAGFVVLFFLGNITISGYSFDPVSLLGYLALFIIVSLSEEIMIRGYVLTNLMDSMNKYVALVVSAILFFLMHGANPNMGVLPAVNLFLAGIVLGIYFIYQRNLWFSVGMHLTWNFFQGPVFGFAVSGQETMGIISQDVSGSGMLTGGSFGFEGSIIETLMSLLIIVVIHWKYRTGKGKVGGGTTLDYS